MASTAREAGSLLPGTASLSTESSLSGRRGEIFLLLPAWLLPGRDVHENKCETTWPRTHVAADLHWLAAQQGLYSIQIFSLPDCFQTPLRGAGQTRLALPLLAVFWRFQRQVGAESGFKSTVCTGWIFGGEPNDVPGTLHFYGQTVGAILPCHWLRSCLILCFSQRLAGLHSCS